MSLENKIIYHAGDDKAYSEYVIDKEEKRLRPMPDGSEISYLYMHGSFPQTNVKFAFFIPEKEDFKGRFFQFLCPFPGPDEENASETPRFGVDDKVAFALYHGAAYVETNMGSKAVFGGESAPDIVIKSNGECAELFRKLVMEKYGCKRPFGYAYGGSGGGYKTMTCAEFSDCFDGVIPHVIGSPVSLPNTITMHAQGQRVLRNAFSGIVDALEPGGSGNMYENLTESEAAMLKELTLMGFPPKAWYVEAMGRIDDGALPVLLPGIKMADPGYFEDFWTVPGYEGSNPESSAVKDRLSLRTKVKAVHQASESLNQNEDSRQDIGGVDTAWKKMLKDGARNFIELEDAPEKDDLYIKGTKIIVESGDAEGSSLMVGRLEGNFAVLGMCFGVDKPEDILEKIKPGDSIRLDNSDYIAVQYYYRHQVPEDDSFHAWDQFRNTDGSPKTPQRSNVFGYSMTGTGHPQDGDIQCKTMVIQALTDESTCPWCGDWYRNKVESVKGSQVDFRLYYMENCMHGNEPGLGSSRVVEYMGALRQMLLDLAEWVENGKSPVDTTRYQLEENQVIVPDNASARFGIQPTAELFANGEKCVHVKPGEEVTLSAKAFAPIKAGEIVSMEFSFEDSKTMIDPDAFKETGTISHSSMDGVDDYATSEVKHIYDKPGTYFATVRVMSNRNPEDPFTCVKNLARARIVVE